MIRRFAFIAWLAFAAAPTGAAEVEPLPKELVEVWQKSKVSCGWMGTSRYDGTLSHQYDRSMLEPGSSIPCFDVGAAGNPELLDKLPQPDRPFGIKIYFKKPGELEQLKRFKNLVRVTMYDGPLGDEGAKILSEMPQLEELQLYGCKLTADRLKTLTRLKNLEKLGLRATGIAEADLQALKAFEKLEHLELGVNLELTDKAGPAIAELKTLKYLDLHLTRVVDEGLKSIAKMSHLRGLYMMNTKATGAGLKTLGALTELERFQMDGHTVNPETISAVLGMKKLRYLTLNIAHADKTAAGDAEFKKLEVLKDLRELSVFGWQITDASLPVIRGFEKLEFLNLTYTNVKHASAQQLQKDMPKCRVFVP
jgi:internalin A